MVDLNWHCIVGCRKWKDRKYMLFTILLLGRSRCHLCICIFFSVKLLRLFWEQFECSVLRVHVWLRCVFVWISLNLFCLLSFLKPSIYAFCQIWRIFGHHFLEYISRPHSHLSLLPGYRWHKSLVFGCDSTGSWGALFSPSPPPQYIFVLVSSSCHMKHHRLGGPNNKSISHSSRGWKSKSKVLALVSAESSVPGLQRLPSCCVLHGLYLVYMWRAGGG